MNFDVNLKLFDRTAHNPSFREITGSMSSAKEELRDYCIPVNPYFPTESMMSSYKHNLDQILKYYPAHSYDTSAIVANLFNLKEEHVVLANGSTELITWIDHLFVRESILTPIPTFGRWTDQPLETGKKVHTIQRLEEKSFRLSPKEIIEATKKSKSRALALCNPNNPTGAIFSRDEVIEIIEGLAELEIIIIDESFIDFSSEENIPSVADIVHKYHNAIVLKSLGKNFGLHGVRMGYAVANTDLAEKLQHYLPRWNVNGIAEAVIRDIPNHIEEYELSRIRVIKERESFFQKLRSITQIKVFPSNANFVFIKIPDFIDGRKFRDHLITNYGLIIRECGNKVGSSCQFIRVAIRPQNDADILVKALRSSLNFFDKEVVHDSRMDTWSA